MAGILDTVDQRTQLVGENRLEILMFCRSPVVRNQRVQGAGSTAAAKADPDAAAPRLRLWVVNLRGQTLPVIDLSQAIGMRPLQPGPDSTIIVTEYNRSVQAFLVGGVDRIVNMNWESIMPPPSRRAPALPDRHHQSG